MTNNIEKEKILIDMMNKIVNMPDPPVVPILRLKHISHLDLDGYGSTFLSEILQQFFFPKDAMVLETVNILQNHLVSELEKTLNSIEKYDLVIITDLAVNQKIVDMIKNHPDRNKIRVFDHHLCNIEDLPDNFMITNKSPLCPEKLTCATELYYNFIKNDKIYTLCNHPRIRENIAYFVECVRVYDTFEFWGTKDKKLNEREFAHFDAPRLNTLFHILERDDFKRYISSFIKSCDTYTTITMGNRGYEWIQHVLEIEQRKNQKYIESAIRRMVKTPFKYSIYKNETVYKMNYLIGVIFAEKSSPIIANTALDRNNDLDFCAVVSNNQVSIYTNKENIDVSAIAKIFGGGGHKEAAGFAISHINASIFNMQHFEKIISCAGNLPYDENEKNYEAQDTSGIN